MNKQHVQYVHSVGVHSRIVHYTTYIHIITKYLLRKKIIGLLHVFVFTILCLHYIYETRHLKTEAPQGSTVDFFKLI